MMKMEHHVAAVTDYLSVLNANTSLPWTILICMEKNEQQQLNE
jgi:hypothetical protein